MARNVEGAEFDNAEETFGMNSGPQITDWLYTCRVSYMEDSLPRSGCMLRLVFKHSAIDIDVLSYQCKLRICLHVI